MASTAGRRVAVVTGAAQGIGRRTAEVFADEGYALVLNDLREPTQTVGSLESRGAEVLAVVGDVSSEDDVLRLRDRALERFGGVHVLVNNAGIALIAPAEQTSAAQWRRVVDVNLTGPFLLCQALGMGMLAAGQGSIVNVASIAGLRGVADRAAGRPRGSGECGVPRLGQDGDGCGGSGAGRIRRCGYHGPGARWPFRDARRRSCRDLLPRRPAPKRLRQRRRASC